jgi:uncharacterized OB-fold protein
MSRPIPSPDAATAEFFRAAKQGKLLIKHCPACDRNLLPQREQCPVCFSRGLEWREASGKGTIYSFVIQHQVLHPAFKDEVPFNIVVVELDEGPRFQSNVVGVDNSEIKVGARVEAVFEDLSDDVAVPKFRLVR